LVVLKISSCAPQIKPVSGFKKQTPRKVLLTGELITDQLFPPFVVLIITPLLPTEYPIEEVGKKYLPTRLMNL
jgi:hypothetical protein